MDMFYSLLTSRAQREWGLECKGREGKKKERSKHGSTATSFHPSTCPTFQMRTLRPGELLFPVQGLKLEIKTRSTWQIMFTISCNLYVKKWLVLYLHQKWINSRKLFYLFQPTKSPMPQTFLYRVHLLKVHWCHLVNQSKSLSNFYATSSFPTESQLF